jgi:hypothetical protein
MKVTLTASTRIEIVVWREEDTYHAHRAGAADEPQICLGVDLFEVVADLAALDLDVPSEAAEAVRLADDAQRRLAGNANDPEPDGRRVSEDRRRTS